MFVLKPIIFYPDNQGCEATWVDRTQAPDIEIAEIPEVPAVLEVLEVLAVPEQLATYDEEGNELTPYVAAVEYVAPVVPIDSIPAVPASTEPGAITEVQVKCHSYHPTQMDMLRADALELGTPLDEYEMDLVALEDSYIPPAPLPVAVPQVITIRQAKLILLAAGLLDDVNAVVAQADRATQIEWEYATEVHRTWPTLLALASAIGLSSEMIDGLFIEGAAL